MLAFRIINVLLFFFLNSAAADAANYYAAPGGDDSNPGTFDQPFRTIDHGVDALAAGDTLYVRGGTYNERVTIWGKAGTASAPVYVTNYPSEKPVIDASAIRSGTGDAVVIGESAYVRFDGFEVRGASKHGVLVYDAHHIKVRWNEVHSNQRHGILVTSADASPAGTTHDVVVQQNNVHHNALENRSRGMRSGWAQGVTGRHAVDVDIVDNSVHENYGEGIGYMTSDGGNVTNNTVYDNYSANIYLDNAQSTKVDRNFVITGWSSTASDFYRNREPADGILTANEYHSPQNPLADLTITNNIIVRCRSAFMYWNGEHGGGLRNTVMANNTFSRSTRRSLTIENSGESELHDAVTIENNVFYATSGTDYAFDPSTTVVYRTNCWYHGNSGTERRGPGDVTADPLLLDAAGWTESAFQLHAASPCKDAGTAEPLVKTDFWGTTRSGRYDIGAHEH